jgi:hypothetical protein
MKHIDEQRLMELALGLAPVSAEAEHMAECGECAAMLAREAEFSLMLSSMPLVAPPAGLMRQIEDAFVVRSARAPAVALALTAVVLAPLTVMVLGRWTELLSNIGSFAIVVRALAGLVFEHGSTPVVLAVQAALLLGGLAVLARLLRATALAPEVMQ